jgi:hypothetical protein
MSDSTSSNSNTIEEQIKVYGCDNEKQNIYTLAILRDNLSDYFCKDVGKNELDFICS